MEAREAVESRHDPFVGSERLGHLNGKKSQW